MATKNDIRVAKEIKVFIQRSLLTIGFSISAYVLFYINLKPPINPPVSYEIRQEFSKPTMALWFSVSDALTTDSKYDNGMLFYYIINDTINEYRMEQFKIELNKITISLLFFFSFILSRYLMMFIKWVDVTSKIQEK